MPRALIVGASDGIGLALARKLLDRGWEVISVSRRLSPVSNDRHLSVVLDVRDAGYRGALASLLDAQGPFDLCVYCAGIGDFLEPATMQPEYDVFAVNLMGAVATGEVVLQRMIAAKAGHFIALSSLADSLFSPATPSYSASKAGLSAWLSGLALALKPHGVAVTNVRFGFVDTKMAKAKSKPFLMSADRAANHVLTAIRRRPTRLSRPFAMRLVVAVIASTLRIRLALGG